MFEGINALKRIKPRQHLNIVSFVSSLDTCKINGVSNKYWVEWHVSNLGVHTEGSLMEKSVTRLGALAGKGRYVKTNFKPLPVWVADNQQQMYQRVDSLPRR